MLLAHLSHRGHRLWLRLGPAHGARGVGVEPHIDATHMKQVLAVGEEPDHLPVLHGAKADGALGGIPLGVVGEGGQGGDGGGVEAGGHRGFVVGGGDAETEEGDGVATVDEVATEDTADVEVEDDDEGDDEDEGEERRG